MSESDREPDVATRIDDLREDREHILDVFRQALDEMAYKCLNGRVRDESKERVRIKQFRALANGVKEYRQLVKDIEEADHEERLQEIEDALDELE